MTDGPYAPLSMNKQWNDVGRALVRPAFEEEAAPCIRLALAGDARRQQVRELSDFLTEALLPKEPELFPDQDTGALEAARARFSTPMTRSVTDHCEQALRDGHAANDAINEGIAACLREQARDNSRTIQAHQMQSEGVAKANEAQSRFEAIFQQMDWEALAQQVRNGETPEANDNRPERDRLDDGPPKMAEE